MQRLMTISEVSEYTQISKSKLYLMVRRGEIPHIKIGKNVRVLESDLEEWIMALRKPASQLGFKFPEKRES